MKCYTWNTDCIVKTPPCETPGLGSTPCAATATWFWIFAGVLGAVFLVRGAK